MTPLWEEVAGQSPDAAATIRAGERSQVSFMKTWAEGRT